MKSYQHLIEPHRKPFTLIELMIVIVIIAMLGMAVMPAFVGADQDARVSSSKSNLQAIRLQIKQFRYKEQRYPKSLEELTTTTFMDAGIKKTYFEADKFPVEAISDSSGNNSIETLNSDESMAGDGGWVYIVDKAEVRIDVTEPLDSSWDKKEGQVPAEW